LLENASATLHDNASARLLGNASVTLHDNASARLIGNASVTLLGNTSATLHDNASATLHDNASARLLGNSSATLHDNARATLYGSASATLLENASATLHDNASARLHDNASATLLENARAALYGNASATSCLATTIHNYSRSSAVSLYDSASAYLHRTPSALSAETTCNIVDESDIITPTFDQWLARGLVVADGIYKRLKSSYDLRNATVYKVTEMDSEEESFIARRGDKYSHGYTVKEAVEDLKYKIADRDLSKYGDWTLETKRPAEEMIEAYRAITGACSAGTREFCERKSLKDEYTVKEVIELTRNQFGNKDFEKFFY
jgi:hypothetical protein